MCAQKCAEPRANIKKRRRHNSSTSAETVWSSRYGCGLSCRHGGESGETCKQYQCAAKDRAPPTADFRDQRRAAEAAWRPGKAPRYPSPEKHTRPVERGRHPVYAGRGPGDPFSDFLDSRSGPLSHFFGLPDALREASHPFSADAPSHQFAYARRAGGAYHQSRRGRPHAPAQAVLPVSPSP